MAGTASRRKSATRRASRGGKDLVSRLTEAGEDTLNRLSELPGGQRAVSAVNDLRNRVDDLSKKVRGIDALETRVAKLEKEVAALRRGSGTSARRPAARKSTTS